MPVIQSAKKALRRDRRRTLVNLRIKRRVKTAIKQFRKEPTKKNLSLASGLLARAAKKKVFHRKKAARLKSRLARQLNSPQK